MPNAHAEVEHIHTEVCVIGGGRAGMAATAAAATAGAQVLLLERSGQIGGHLLFDQVAGSPPVQGDLRSRYGFRHPEIQARIDHIAKLTGLRVLCNTTAFGLYEGNMLGAVQGDRLLKIRARHIIVATGGRQRPFVFRNNDLPGVLLAYQAAWVSCTADVEVWEKSRRIGAS